LTSLAQYNRRKVWKWIFLLAEKHPFARLHFSAQGDVQSVIFRAENWQREFVIKDSGLSVSGEGQTLSFDSRELRTEPVIAQLNALLNPPALLSSRGSPRVHDHYKQALKALCLHARAQGSVVSTTAYGAWDVGNLVFAPNGTLQAGAALVDLVAPAFQQLRDEDKIAALARLASGLPEPTTPSVAITSLNGPSPQAAFAPESDEDILLVRRELGIERWQPSTGAVTKMSPPLRPGFVTFWSGNRVTWLVTSAGQAVAWPPSEPAIETGVAPRLGELNKRPIFVANTGVFAAALEGNRIRVLREAPAAAAEGLVEQFSRLKSGAPHGVEFQGTALAFEAGYWLVAASGNAFMRVFDCRDDQVHSTEDGLVGGHPEGCAINTCGTLAAQVSSNVSLFDPATGRLLFAARLAHGPRPDVVFHSAISFLLIRQGGSLLALRLDTLQLRLLLTMSELDSSVEAHSALTISESGDRVVAARDHTYLFDWVVLEQLFRRSPDLPLMALPTGKPAVE